MTSNRTLARASEAGEPTTSPQRKLWVRYQPKHLSPSGAACIRNQVEHHRKFNHQEEFLALLRKHGVEYDERYIWH